MHRRDVLALSSASLVGCVGRESDVTTDETGELTTGAEPTTDGETNRTLATDGGTDTPGDGSLTLSSSAFEDGETLPNRFTCEGKGVSPPLSIAGVPDETESLALVVDDPDAPGSDPFVHWLLWNLAPDTATIPEDVPDKTTVLDGARQGTNGGGNVGYFPACPPKGHGTHTYRFTLYAVDQMLDVKAAAERSQLQRALDESNLAQARITATFERSG
ncbi:YbhB/YbcL family Raf kinase inhibitor-like protein [Halogeometricum borinquense]|uniref:YbhB/YbcL family Raf kinase inhibitor-like protein n=1 Tax=Halogeometricum borinquense TaxID=60847 RepID=A0A482TI27_9EURY|nr:YbhB/YbcL family Raf kinase inhibitor-like protein [Halogeometricum borinquense]RYJ14848.1 YbhB/YbcL family Raf kinase inhibitor-like protein [Halogeometricum borinquense]